MRSFVLGAVAMLTTISCSERYKRYFPPDPTLETRILDKGNLLNDQQKDSIFNLIKQVDDSIGSQIAIIIVDTLGGEDLTEFSVRQAIEMRLGRYDYRDGLLITVVAKEKMVRIGVGEGLEKVISDELATKIIQDVFLPNFRKRNYGLGLYSGVDTIRKLMKKNRELIGDFDEN